MAKAYESEREETARLVALSDGVIAIAITLLVLDLTVPTITGTATDRALAELVFEQWHELFGYVLSFLVIGLYWVLHRRVFIYVTGHDRRVLWLNLGFLLLVAFLPYATSLFSTYPTTRFGVVFYSVVQAMTGLSLALLWVHAARRHLIAEGLTSPTVLLQAARFLATPTVFLFAALLAFVNPTFGILSWLLVVPVNGFFELRLGRATA
ncbi:TMEM175 family protein [Haloarchaeobius sp. DYHT-AS-18]|uniref:TMEM175 family protein n=1 Tax=Haloarchaeobius sp. DYHT-AS-18 TaxID=3446117 RepID=UPI003EBA8C6E